MKTKDISQCTIIFYCVGKKLITLLFIMPYIIQQNLQIVYVHFADHIGSLDVRLRGMLPEQHTYSDLGGCQTWREPEEYHR